MTVVKAWVVEEAVSAGEVEMRGIRGG